jgi:hypothetical protein
MCLDQTAISSAIGPNPYLMATYDLEKQPKDFIPDSPTLHATADRDH